MMQYTTMPLIKKSDIEAWEQTPVVIDGELYRIGFARPWGLGAGNFVSIHKYLPDHDCWSKVARIPWSRFLGSAFVDNGRLYIFGSTDISNSTNEIVRQEIDVATWSFTGPELHVRTSSGGYKFFNTSVCKGPDKYIMAYETNEAVAFSLRFLQSTDFVDWSPIGDLCNANIYSACPTVKYAKDGYYIVNYLFDLAGNGTGPWITAMARTSDFIHIENFAGNSNYTCYQQLMAPDMELEGINSSDIDYTEWNGKVYFTYLTGDQRTWAASNDAWFEGSIIDLYHCFWP